MKLNISYVNPCSESKFIAMLDFGKAVDLEKVQETFGGNLSGNTLKTQIDGKDVLVFKDHAAVKYVAKEYEAIKIINKIRNL